MKWLSWVFWHLPHITAALVTGWISFEVFNRQAPVIYKSILVSNGTVSPGDTIEMDVSAIWRRPCPGSTTFVFVDSSGAYRITGTMEINPPPKEMLGKEIHYKVSRVVPHMKAGPAYYYGLLRLNCSDIWPITIATPWVPFTVKTAMVKHERVHPDLR